MDARVRKWKNAKVLEHFDGNILLFGCGAVGRALLPILTKLLSFKSLTILDQLDNRRFIKHYLKKPNIKYVQLKITKGNYRKVLRKYLKKGDFLIDLAYEIGTQELLNYCHLHGIKFINTSVEEFDHLSGNHKVPQDFTLYERNYAIRKNASKWHRDKMNPTQILDCGANPGWVSCMTKQGIVDIAHAKFLNNPKVSQVQKDKIKHYLKNNYFKLLAYEIGLKVIHITEKDTQISSQPKKENEFVNTWSLSGFAEETTAPAELGWGTHEKKLPSEAFTHHVGEKNQICLHLRGCNKMMRSWTRCGPFIGMLVRHGEAYSISSRLTLFPSDVKNPRSYIHDPQRHMDHHEKPIYRPTVHFVYLPCDNGMATIHMLREREYIIDQIGPTLRTMFNDIISGIDEVGCLLVGDFGFWWLGTSIDIVEARKLINPKENCISATTIPVAASVAAGVIYAIRHPNVGLCFADDIDYKEYLQIANLVTGPLHSYEMTPKEMKITQKEAAKLKTGQFANFEVNEYIL